MLKNKLFYAFFFFAAVVAVAALMYWRNNASQRLTNGGSNSKSAPAISETVDKSGKVTEESASATGATDKTLEKGKPAVAGAEKPQADSATAKKNDASFDLGKFTGVRADANPQVASVHDALRTKTHAERLSPLLPPKPFDPKEYKADPEAYLNVVEPGRVFQPAQPGKGVPLSRPLSPPMQDVAQGGSVTLQVQGAPSSPFTFTSFDGGTFENKLNSMTVAADASGRAKVTFHGSSGTLNAVNILAASPLSSGQVKYVVNVTKN